MGLVLSFDGGVGLPDIVLDNRLPIPAQNVLKTSAMSFGFSTSLSGLINLEGVCDLLDRIIFLLFVLVVSVICYRYMNGILFFLPNCSLIT